MQRRRVIGLLLIGVSLLSFSGALLDLPVRFAAGMASDPSLLRAVSVFWLVGWLALLVALLVAVTSGDRIGFLLGCVGVCLSTAYIAMRYLAGRLDVLAGGQPPLLQEQLYFVLAPTMALSLSVVTTILGWHLLMPPRAAGDHQAHVA